MSFYSALGAAPVSAPLVGVCAASDCDQAVTAVTALGKLFIKVGRPGKFKARVSDVMNAYQPIQRAVLEVRGVPSSTVCCAARQVGIMADDLRADIEKAFELKSSPGIVKRTPIEKAEQKFRSIQRPIEQTAEEISTTSTLTKFMLGVSALGVVVGLGVFAWRSPKKRRRR